MDMLSSANKMQCFWMYSMDVELRIRTCTISVRIIIFIDIPKESTDQLLSIRNDRMKEYEPKSKRIFCWNVSDQVILLYLFVNIFNE